MPGSAIYTNGDSTVILLDLPASLAEAQKSALVLRSTVAADKPFPSTEPKGTKRTAALASINAEERDYHCTIQLLVASALTEVHAGISGPAGTWFLPRRRAIGHKESGVLELHLPCDGGGGSYPSKPPQVPVVVLSSTQSVSVFPHVDTLRDVVVFNPREDTSAIEISGVGAFYVPPRSAFILSTLQRGSLAFSWGCNFILPAPRDGFDLIVMDPPWMNRSVRHAGTYKTAENQHIDPFTQAIELVRCSISASGLLAVWITNKTAVRQQVVKAALALHLHLSEEWIWIKVTSEGEPVSVLDGIWRRPYEILLIFRHKAAGVRQTSRRVIAAVPDLHSRKPSLKRLFDHLLPSNYTALEMFARNLTAGWWSWGDEVLKFQHDSQWTSQADVSPHDTCYLMQTDNSNHWI